MFKQEFKLNVNNIIEEMNFISDLIETPIYQYDDEIIFISKLNWNDTLKYYRSLIHVPPPPFQIGMYQGTKNI